MNFTVYRDRIFLAALSSSQSGSGNPVIFDRAEINPGGYYDPTTGYYTVSYDGIYQFHVQMAGYSSSDTLLIDIRVDGSAIGSHNDDFHHEGYRTATVLLELQAAQTVSVYRSGGALGSSNYLQSYFHGYMISSN